MEVVEGFALLKRTRLKKKLRQVQIKYRGIFSGLVEEQTQKYILSTPWQPVNVSKNTHFQHSVEIIRSHVSPSSLSKVPSQWYPSIMEYFWEITYITKILLIVIKFLHMPFLLGNLQLKVKTCVFFLLQNYLTTLIYPMNLHLKWHLKLLLKKDHCLSHCCSWGKY